MNHIPIVNGVAVIKYDWLIMKLIYRAKDIIEAHIISGLLKANGIRSHVGGYYLQGGVGNLAATDFATIYVADENVLEAQSIIAGYENT